MQPIWDFAAPDSDSVMFLMVFAVVMLLGLWVMHSQKEEL